MPQRKSKPVTWRPRGVSDCLESSEAFNGAMGALTNVIPDPTTKGLYQCRPAATVINSLPSFALPQFISALQVFGRYAYGLVNSISAPGFDLPFVLDLVNNSLIFVSGVGANNIPRSLASSGPWVPPQMAAVGSKIVVTHQGFAATGYMFGYFDISTPTSPKWGAGNCSGTGFGGFAIPPTAVAQFSGRAYFIYNLPSQPAVIFSDVNNPLTNGGGGIVPILTFGDTQQLTALAGLPLNNQLGGIIQSLMVFKDDSNIYQITGDASTSNLAINTLNVPTGTSSPASVVPTPKGLGFISPDGLRIIDFTARVSDVIGNDGSGVAIPFIFQAEPSRTRASANGSVYRVSVQNGALVGSPWQEWWYDFARSTWSGPHTCACSMISPYQNTFICSLVASPNKVYRSDYEQGPTSTFVENNVQLTYIDASVLFPDTDRMTQNWLTETTLDIQYDQQSGAPNVLALTQDSTLLNSVSFPSLGTPPQWSAAVWGAFIWGGISTTLVARQVPWTVPISFARMQIVVTGVSSQRLRLGSIHMRYTDTGIYVDPAAVAVGARFFTIGQSSIGGPDVID